MSKPALVAPTRPPLVAESAYPVPTLAMFRSVNVATPAAAATVLVPLSTAPPAPVPGVMATVMGPVNPAAPLPNASSATTRTAGAMTSSVAAGVGWTENARRAAAAGAPLNGAPVGPPSPLPDAGRG